jgi:hypothetical protein
MFGRWETSPAEYAAAAQRYRAEIGRLEWGAPQDWMCEPVMIHGGPGAGGRTIPGTKLSVSEHQRRTVASYLELRRLAPDVPWIPVLQGWEIDDYLACVRLYDAAGVDLDLAPVVGVGSVCRRQATDEAAQLLAELSALGLPLHGFGLKIDGLRKASCYLSSSDSMAWSLDARRGTPLPGCTHRKCNNCLRYALRWREKVFRAVERPCQRLMTWHQP